MKRISSITITIEEHENVPEPFVAFIEGEKYRGIVVQGKSALDCLDALTDSLRVLELHTGKKIS